jgi:hypothetical protein
MTGMVANNSLKADTQGLYVRPTTLHVNQRLSPRHGCGVL